MKYESYDSTKEHRYFQQRPWLPTIEGSVIIDPEPKQRKNNIMFTVRFKDGSYLSKDGERTSLSKDIRWFEYYMAAEYERLIVGGNTISSHDLLLEAIDKIAEIKQGISRSIKDLEEFDGECAIDTIRNSMTILREIS